MLTKRLELWLWPKDTMEIDVQPMQISHQNRTLWTRPADETDHRVRVALRSALVLRFENLCAVLPRMHQAK